MLLPSETRELLDLRSQLRRDLGEVEAAINRRTGGIIKAKTGSLSDRILRGMRAKGSPTSLTEIRALGKSAPTTLQRLVNCGLVKRVAPGMYEAVA